MEATGDEGGIVVTGTSTLILDVCCFCCQVAAWFSVISALYTVLEVPWALEELGPGLYDDDDVVAVDTCTLILESPGDIDGVDKKAVEDAEVEEGYMGNVAPAAV